MTVGRIQRLRTGLGLNYAAIGLVLDLLDHIEELGIRFSSKEDITVDINKLTQKSQEALAEAQPIATRMGHNEVDGEHLLMALIDQPEGLVPRLLDQAGADTAALRADLERELNRRPKVGAGLGCHDPALSDLILCAYLLRRSPLIQEGTGFRIIGSCFDPDTLRVRESAARNRLPHRWIDLERDKHAERLLQRFEYYPKRRRW